jgi:hypothetical protein
MLTPPSRQVTPASAPPIISKLAKAFVDSLTVRQLSNFLVWMLYYDVVEYPTSAETWYGAIEPMEMQGWLALGDFLSKFPQNMDTGYGLDLVVLDSICDRLRLQRSTVHEMLIQFADSSKMRFSTVAIIVNAGSAMSKTELELLEEVQSKLQELCKLASHLKPEENTVYDAWHAIVLKRLRGFLHLVIKPRIPIISSGTPLITAATNEHLPKEVKDGIKLKYMFEVIQLERHVPVHRYGVQNVPTLSLMTPPSSPPDVQDVSSPDADNTEHAQDYAMQLMVENRELRAQVASLQHDKDKLQESNDKLARKVATLGRIQPLTYQQPQPSDEELKTMPSQSPASTDEHPPSANLQVPAPSTPPRPRSLSHDTGSHLASRLDSQLHTTNHKRQHSDLLSWKYEDVFLGFDSPPSPPIRLSYPLTGEPLEPPASSRNARRGISYGAGTSRRSGVIFTNDQKMLLAAVREGTPRVSGEDGEGGTAEMGTPTPAGKERAKSR